MVGTSKRTKASRSSLAEHLQSDFGSDLSLVTGTKATAPARLVSWPHGLPVMIGYGVIDFVTVSLSGSFILYLQLGIVPSFEILRSATRSACLAFTFLYPAMVLLSCASQDLYRTPRDRGAFEESLMVVRAIILATIVLVLFVFVFDVQGISRVSVLMLAALSVAALSGWRYLKRRLIIHRTLQGIGVSRVAIVGTGRIAKGFATFLADNPQFGCEVCGFLAVEPSSDRRVLGLVSDLRKVALEQFLDELFLVPPIDREIVKQLVLETRQLRMSLKVIPDMYDGHGWRAPLHAIGGFPVMQLNSPPIPGIGVAAKRLFDVLISATGLLLTLPILGILAILVRLDSPGPAFYSAHRVGYKARKFRCWKLRTMFVDADRRKDMLRKENGREGPFFKIKNDPRVTRVGHWLRKFSLDELPQLWNVLWGEMSMVGPRPHPVDDFERYSVEHMRRLDVKPGLTGLWQVTARQNPSFETNLALDLEYIENWSPWLDLEILFRSIPEVLTGKGE
jgi:exopolysaccharide biosynthesis polyprenyl glycosylphosphotransferase